tara:strand:- start:1584 stop:2219 length:636 start_codon:yes stop_codon:yes gene_type:complete
MTMFSSFWFLQEATLIYSADATNVNLLSDAVAVGFNATVGGVLNVVINSGITLSGTTTNAISSGNFPANSIVTITNNGTVSGYTGANGTSGATGGVGSDAFYAEFTASGSIWSIINNGTWGGGGGGGGSYGSRLTQYPDKYGSYCAAPTLIGSAGVAGGLGEAGTSGSNPGNPIAYGCWNYYAAAGGAAGYAVRKNGLTIATTGTFLGTVG